MPRMAGPAFGSRCGSQRNRLLSSSYAVHFVLSGAEHGRNAWLWFFLGAAFSVIALAVLLYKNAEGRRPASNSQRPAEPGAAPDRGDT